VDIAGLIRTAAARIGGETPRLDAELIVAHALGVSREALLLGDPDVGDAAAVEALVARRAAGEPVAYILGRQEFWSLDFEVTPDVLIPRADTETLIEAARRRFDRDRPLRILDLGTGSGALIVAALTEWPRASGVASDISPAALAIARRNADRHGVSGRCAFRCADWDAGIEGPFDLVLSNPPYIAATEALGPGVAEHEPGGALFAGADGLDAYRRLVPALPRLLAPRGFAVLEIGHRQAAAVLAIGRASRLEGGVECDLGGRDRAVVFHRR
jgi:release factor glutamine methyltransferase